ncbi:bifunctional DNA primase/polymerase [Nocardia sp. NPDC052278]|uniref:bifunctional DNA primase/polymerase n=1 Tax=unclassified Nocardia TaxID=2637762 RepID=UPI0036B4A246
MAGIDRGVRSTRLMRAALGAAARGHHIFPLWPRTKRPAVTKDWELNATNDPARIRHIWQQLPYNIGIACGPSGLYVLDLDDSRGEPAPARWAGLTHGREVLDHVAREAGQPFPGDTYTVGTPSGGLHLYYSAPAAPELPNTVAGLGWHIDTRGSGGYVVGAGSVLTNGFYTVLDGRRPEPIPEWLITALTPPPAPPPGPPVELTLLQANAYVSKAVHSQTTRIRNAPVSQRHYTLLSAANALGRLVGAQMLTHNDAYAMLYDAARQHIGVANFTDLEANRTITDGLRHGATRPQLVNLRHP